MPIVIALPLVLPAAVDTFGPSLGPSAFPSAPVVYTGDPNGGVPGAGLFVGFVVIAILVGIGTMIYRVTTARRIAEQNGLDPGDATRVALLNDNAVTATYLASNLQRQRQQSTPAAPAARVRSVKERLDELHRLHDAGEISDDEYAEGRKHIINGA